MARVALNGRTPADYLALGDSYTIGEGVEPGGRWPEQLAVMLRDRGIAIADPQLIAKSGWTTDELSAAIDAARDEGRLLPAYGLVSLLIGVNNQYRGRDVDEYAIEFAGLLDRAIAFAGDEPGNALVVSIPDWSLTPYAVASGRDRAQIAAQIDGFNEVSRRICEETGVTWVDVTDISRQPELAQCLVADGLHPSADMYGRWAERIQAAMPH